MHNVKKVLVSLILVLSLIVGSVSVFAANESPSKLSVKDYRLAYTSTVYTGTAKKPAVYLFDANGDYIPKEYVEVTYSNNKNVGTATVNVVMYGKYSGTKTMTFNITKATPKVKTSKTASYSKLKKGAVSVGDCVTGAGAGKVTKKSGSKYLTVTSAGVVKVKKGTKKGTYKITVKVAATKNCKGVTKTITVKVK